MQRLINPDVSDLHYHKKEFIPVFDENGQIDLKDMLERMQDLYAEHIERIGVGEAFKEEANFFYIVMRMKGYFLRKIKPGEKFTLVTYPVATTSIQMYRYTYMLDEKNQPVFYHISLWVLMNPNTRRIMTTKPWNDRVRQKLPDIDSLVPITDEKLQNFSIDDYHFEDGEDYIVTEKDIDSNGHMNNAVYLKLSQDRTSSQQIQIFEIDFEKECFLNEKISIQVSKDRRHLITCGYKPDQTLSFKTIIQYW